MRAHRTISTGYGITPTNLNADVIAIQEVDGRAVAARLFPADRYSIHMTHDDVVQRVGIVVRRGLPYDVNPDVTGLDVDPHQHLRSGADITLHFGAMVTRILAVHLKTGCHDSSLTRHARRSCVELRRADSAVAGMDCGAAAGGRAVSGAGRFQPPHGRQGPALGGATPCGAAGAGDGGAFKPLLGHSSRSSTTSSPAVRRGIGCRFRHCGC